MAGLIDEYRLLVFPGRGRPRAGFLGGSRPATVPVKLPVFCLAACVRMRYFTCAHQPTLTGAVMWWSRLSPAYWHLRVREEWAGITGSDWPVSRKTSVWMAQVV
jgi:hypothetical protein